MKTRMCNSLALVKQEFLKNWMKGLHIYTNFKKDMGVVERKKAIKLSANVAMASTRNGSTRWSRAILADASQAGASTRTLVQQAVGSRGAGKNRENGSRIACSMKIIRRSHMARRRRVRARGVVPHENKASSIARKLLKKRTRVLKRLVPGGEELDDEVSLIKETLDYIVSLRVQVDVMRRLAQFAETTLERASNT